MNEGLDWVRINEDDKDQSEFQIDKKLILQFWEGDLIEAIDGILE